MEKALGHVFKYGDNVDTDVIIPARYLNSFDAQELASHAMVDIDPDFVKNVKKGDLIVANKNFGCGSSREHAYRLGWREPAEQGGTRGAGKRTDGGKQKCSHDR